MIILVTCAAVSRANRYQALPLIFYSPLDRGDSLGMRLAENSQIMSSPSSGDRKDHMLKKHNSIERTKISLVFMSLRQISSRHGYCLLHPSST